MKTCTADFAYDSRGKVDSKLIAKLKRFVKRRKWLWYGLDDLLEVLDCSGSATGKDKSLFWRIVQNHFPKSYGEINAYHKGYFGYAFNERN